MLKSCTFNESDSKRPMIWTSNSWRSDLSDSWNMLKLGPNFKVILFFVGDVDVEKN